eukprot:3318044-Prymnesium_polylepis.1
MALATIHPPFRFPRLQPRASQPNPPARRAEPSHQPQRNPAAHAAQLIIGTHDEAITDAIGIH